jgi:predicted DNA-binding transcriptional regulator AlpA
VRFQSSFRRDRVLRSRHSFTEHATKHRSAQDASIDARSTSHRLDDDSGHNACMDSNQTKIMELLREVHLLAFKEIERLNLRISEFESQQPQPVAQVLPRTAVEPTPPIKSETRPHLPEMMNERQVAEFLNMSVASVRRWRLFRRGPRFVKIGSAVRYRREDLETWLSSCPGLR